ncbi:MULTISPECIES: two-component system histidine kinase PnpS [Exiguobacterium]|uniref:histidine kinase n=1 Tax=Exiguobacterium alkaliphilum TaxID=1428684 RepID=A0ABT2KSY6_9BACL|nr:MULTISPECIES: HAMP domain-containing sensor histidine kinase [Exiguobacterium]MCT4794077.1 ATP-binding protein [Exiguobacterium alkaliphilum]QUE87645.1 PAS domain S-box protein [Exiguobacterium alkaliphilum]
MKTYRSRFLTTLILLVTGVLLTLGIVLGQLFKDFYLDSERDRLKEDTKLAALYLDGGELNEIQDYVGQIDDESSFDILLLNRNMQVIAGTPFRVGSFEYRVDPETISSDGEFGNATRDDLIQFTKPITLSSEETVYLSFIRYVSDLESVYNRIWMTIAFALFFSFFIILFVLHNLTNQFIRPIDEATIVLRELADGNYRARVYELRNDAETGSLAGSINVLARNLETISLGEAVQRARLESLIEYMGAGLLLVDERGIVTLVNRSYRDMFQYDELMIGQFYHGILPSPDVETLIEDVYLTEEPHRRQLSIRTGFNQRTYMVSAAPIFSDTGMLRGTTLLFNDISELKRLEKMRKDFVANVSHELKTPLTSIRGFSETLLDGAKEVPELRDQFLDIIQKEATRMQMLVEDLLELSRLEREDFHLEFTPVQLNQLVEEVSLVLSQKAERKSIQLETRHDGEVMLQADMNRIKQVILNLVANAINYSPEGSRVEIAVERNDAIGRLIVKDNGIGIAEKEISRIFERFYRVDKARSRNSGGTGLGLAIVKHIVDLHHATIQVDSVEGEGTTFTIEFPLP